MKHLFTSYGSYGDTGDTARIDSRPFYRPDWAEIERENLIALWAAREGHEVIDDGVYQGKDYADRNIWTAFVVVLRTIPPIPTDPVIPYDPRLRDRSDLPKSPLREEKKSPWRYILPIGGGVIVVGLIGTAIYYGSKKKRRG